MNQQQNETEPVHAARLELGHRLTVAHDALNVASLVTASARIACGGGNPETIGATIAKLEIAYTKVREVMIHVQIATSKLFSAAEPDLFTANPTGPQGPNDPT